MWLFTPFGFYSIVRKTPGPELTIRGRTLGDLQRLRARFLPSATEPVSQAGTDYPWRMRCTEQALAAAIPALVASIDYANFKDAVAKVTGPARATRYGKVWDVLYGMPEDKPEPAPAPAPDAKPAPAADGGWANLPWSATPPTGKKLAFGGVVMDTAGRVLLREVANHFDGYVWSFAKGRPDPGETPQQAALREVQEEMGVAATIVGALPGAYDGNTTRTHYFLMRADADAVDPGFACAETARVRWATVAEAKGLLGMTQHATGRERDWAVLAAGVGAWGEMAER
jgi:8-oxo-dGTP pyrophosphatase MutT (NUDIX family)